MRTGKLNISRGHEIGDRSGSPCLSLVPMPMPMAPLPPPEHLAVAPPVSAEYGLVHDRLTALERLTRLRGQDAISDEEFAREKAIVLGLPADELLLFEPEPIASRIAAPGSPSHRPSLLGRVFSWKFLPVGLAAGLGLSFASQPQETSRFFEEALRLVGA